MSVNIEAAQNAQFLDLLPTEIVQKLDPKIYFGFRAYSQIIIRKIPT